eukprot:SAG31_NODE_37384_length_304_cov_2.034146_1_plen_65_part_01
MWLDKFSTQVQLYSYIRTSTGTCTGTAVAQPYRSSTYVLDSDSYIHTCECIESYMCRNSWIPNPK